MSEALSRAQALTANHSTETLRLTGALNNAIVVVWLFAALGIATWHAEQQYERQDRIDQENIATAKGAASWH